ncbi:hypothetical protein PTI98_011657 [Pleurotus ostreatus]|nr:hypothetical protein PTI98_011657 [Pleurotus ostreatus]
MIKRAFSAINLILPFAHLTPKENMSFKIFVGGLSWNTTDDTLRQAFGEFGNVLDSIVINDRETGRSRGFGFVTYGTNEEAEAAIAGYDQQELDGRRIKVVVEVEVEATEVVVAVVVTKVEEEAMEEEEEEAVSVGNLFSKQCFAPDCLVVCSLDVLRVFIRIPSFA